MMDEPGLWQMEETKKLADLEVRRRNYVRLVETLENLPRSRVVKGMLPFGPRAIVPGKVVHTNEVMVLLGESYFAEVSAYDAAAIAKRRIAELDRNIRELTSSNAVAMFDSLAEEKRNATTAPGTTRPAKDFNPSKAKHVSSQRAKRSVTFASDVKERNSQNGGHFQSSAAHNDGDRCRQTDSSRIPESPAERAELLKRFAEGLESAREILAGQEGEGVVLLEEEYEDNTATVPVRVHGLPGGKSPPGISEASEEGGRALDWCESRKSECLSSSLHPYFCSRYE